MLTEARRRGFEVDENNLAAELDHTAAHLKRGEENYRAGQGQGGKADTAGWALWTLEAGERKPDGVTEAVAQYLLNWQSDRDHWRSSGNRPPTEASDFTTTYVALRGLAYFGTEAQQREIDRRRERALKWLLDTEAIDTEDRVFRLRSLEYLSADQGPIESAARDLLARQADDGGWGQLDGMTSDAYATGTALVTLCETGHLTATDARFRKGVHFLLRTQFDDGSWRVATRSRPIQKYFESGFPHSTDQFISISATCWATTTLLLACPLASP
jgi:N-acyl-D-amino-acid deacylase